MFVHCYLEMLYKGADAAGKRQDFDHAPSRLDSSRLNCFAFSFFCLCSSFLAAQFFSNHHLEHVHYHRREIEELSAIRTLEKVDDSEVVRQFRLAVRDALGSELRYHGLSPPI